MIVKAFLRWSEKAGSRDRSKAASALARAYLQSSLPDDKHLSAYEAMTHLLDDPSPKVRLALAEGLSSAHDAPRHIIRALAEDQAEIACVIIIHSPVLRENDLVDLAVCGTAVTRAIIAARPFLDAGVCAALAEISDVFEIVVLLENASARIAAPALCRIAERYADDAEIRDLLLRREDLPAEVRHVVLAQVGVALAASPIVSYAMTHARANAVIRDACETATVAIAGEASGRDLSAFVETLRLKGELTPIVLLNGLCRGKLDFFAEAISNLSGLEAHRVHSVLSTGRHHALKALFHSAGIAGAALAMFIEAVFQWRKVSTAEYVSPADRMAEELVARFGKIEGDAALRELVDMVEKLQLARSRQRARCVEGDIVANAA